ncbi:hypothetical protein HYT52_05240 [Candidatus Woesearchaeota archaeon]|nr:hypothetical protein [Candidatus Woesearchaeota archaeon]
MQILSILNTRDIKKIREALIQQFGFFFKDDYAYLKNDKYRVFIINKDISQLELNNLIIDKTGLYFGEIMKNGEFRLSKEGAQLLVHKAQELKEKLHNTIELNQNQVKEYFQGFDLPYNFGAENKQVLLFYEKNVLGCARYKEGKILNFLPKIHRGEVII